jgi:sporulation protein YlmC with PRC-barrel domain
MKARDLFGKEVVDVDAKVVGKVADVDLDIGKAKLVGILVKTGLTKKMSISPTAIDRIGDKVLLKITKDKVHKT